MKKVLIASTALVAAGLMSVGTASASEKIKLNLGGYSKWWIVAAQQDDDFTKATNGDYNTVDVKGDNEVFFGGSTTLDNGLKVGIDIQLEAGGHTDTVGGDVIDESYVWLSGGFGKFIVGSENNGTYLLHVSAPDAAGNWNEGGMLTGNGGGNSSTAIARPAAVGGLLGGNTTAIVTDGDADKITYVAPTFYGLTLGASYVPNTTEDNRGATVINASTVTASEIYGVGALYANTFGGVGLKVSGGWVTYDIELGLPGKTGVNEFSTGAQLSYAGFTLGSSYRKINTDRQNAAVYANDGDGWDVGLQYASGPYAVSFAYFTSSVEGATTGVGAGSEDEITVYQLSGKYALGAGVDALASIGHMSYEDETGLAANENKGWVAMTGLSLAF